jgi:hypothetical protein
MNSTLAHHRRCHRSAARRRFRKQVRKALHSFVLGGGRPSFFAQQVADDAHNLRTTANSAYVPGGMDAMSHAARRYAQDFLQIGSDRVIFKADFRSAFNCCVRAQYDCSVAAYGEDTAALRRDVPRKSRRPPARWPSLLLTRLARLPQNAGRSMVPRRRHRRRQDLDGPMVDSLREVSAEHGLRLNLSKCELVCADSEVDRMRLLWPVSSFEVNRTTRASRTLLCRVRRLGRRGRGSFSGPLKEHVRVLLESAPDAWLVLPAVDQVLSKFRHLEDAVPMVHGERILNRDLEAAAFDESSFRNCRRSFALVSP